MYTKIHLPRMLRNLTLAGLLGVLLRLVLYRIGPDEKNLLPRFHVLHLLCLGLALVAAVHIFLGLKGQPRIVGSDRYRTGSRAALALAAVLLAVHGLRFLSQLPDPLSLARMALTFAGALGILLLALPVRLLPGISIGIHVLLCILFLLETLCRYRTWSGNPQLPDYIFHVPACVMLVLGTYHRLALHCGLGKPRPWLITGLLGYFLCLLSLTGPEHWSYYLAGALWLGGSLLLPLPARETPEEAE